jgi:hypothetical protein
MYSARDDTALPVPGFPIRESAGQRLFSTSPRLIAAVHALLRLLMPRHPPCALTILTVIVDSRRIARRATGKPAARRSLAPAYNGDLQRRPASHACAAAIPLLFGQLCSFQGPARAQPRGLRGWSLKTQQCKAQTSCASRPGRRFGTPAGHEAGRAGSAELSSLERR